MKALFEYPHARMTGEQTQLLMGLYLLHEDSIKKGIEEISNELLYQVMRKRLDVLKLDVDDRVILLILGGLEVETPGAVALYVYALFRMRTKETTRINLDVFSGYFHSGFPSAATLGQAWDDQKTPKGHNLVDAEELYV